MRDRYERIFIEFHRVVLLKVLTDWLFPGPESLPGPYAKFSSVRENAGFKTESQLSPNRSIFQSKRAPLTLNHKKS